MGIMLTVPRLPETTNCRLPQPLTSTELTKIRASAFSYSSTERLLSATSTPSKCVCFKKLVIRCGSPSRYTIKSTRWLPKIYWMPPRNVDSQRLYSTL